LYLPPPGPDDPTGGQRAIGTEERASKMKELWERWTWLEDYSSQHAGQSAYLCGNFLSIADLTWFPTAVFMEFLLVHVAEWPVLFADVQNGQTQDFFADASWGDWVQLEKWNPGPVSEKMARRFPKLSTWYPKLLQIDQFRKVRGEILGFWLRERHFDGLDADQDPRPRKRFPPIKKAIGFAVDNAKRMLWMSSTIELVADLTPRQAVREAVGAIEVSSGVQIWTPPKTAKTLSASTPPQQIAGSSLAQVGMRPTPY